VPGLYIVEFFAGATGTVSSAVGAVPNEMVAVLATIPGISRWHSACLSPTYGRNDGQRSTASLTISCVPWNMKK